MASTYEPIIKFWVKAEPQSGQVIFSFSEYIAALALLFVVISISEYRYRLRLALAGRNTQRKAFFGAVAVGFLVLATDFWFYNQLPVPFFLNSATNIKLFLGVIFLTSLLGLCYTVFLKPPQYRKPSAVKYAEVAYQIIGDGDRSKIQTLLSELGPSLPAVFEIAAQISDVIKPEQENSVPAPSPEIAASNDFLLLLADPRVCEVVAASSPWFAVDAVRAYQLLEQKNVPFAGFLRNTSRAFFRNKASAIYLENSGYESGLIGYLKPVSSEIYGDFRTVESCASAGQSPFDLDYKELMTFDGEQAEAVCRCATLFFESYVKVTSGRAHSYALTRLMSELSLLVHGLERLNQPSAREWSNPEEARLDAVVDFIRGAIEILDAHEIPQQPRQGLAQRKDSYQYIAELIFELIFKSTSVNTTDFISWHVQHNSIWGQLFGLGETRAHKIVRTRLFRLMFDEIKRMDTFPNFKGARILAYCLNVLGLKPGNRHEGYGKEDYPLRKLAHDWVKANYRNLVENHPKVAEACLTFRVEYDAENHRLVKTYADETRKEPKQSYLELD